MALRYRKSVKLGKGVKLNVGKNSAGLSFGGKLGGVSFNSRSGARVRASAPGTGLSYTKKVGRNVGKKKLVRDFEDFAASENTITDKSVQEDIDKRLRRNMRAVNICLLVVLLSIGTILGFTSFFFYFSAVIYIIILISGRKITKKIPQVKPDVMTQASVSAYVEVNGVKPQENAKNTDNNDEPKNYQIKRHKVTGTSHYQFAFESIGIDNPDYDMSKKDIVEEDMIDERIYEYTFVPDKVELIPEPTNEYDPNAIKVVVDDLLIGYIKAGSCAHLLKLMRENRMGTVSIDMYGGKYKCVTSEYDDDEYKETYILEKDSSPYGAVLEIVEYA